MPDSSANFFSRAAMYASLLPFDMVVVLVVSEDKIDHIIYI